MRYSTSTWSKNTLWFSIIEVLVGIFIFSLGLTSIFALLTSSLNLNELNKNKIIASNLAREQIELVRNIRDTNYTTLHSWDLWDPTGSVNNRFEIGKYYKIENNFDGGFHVSTEEIQNFWEGASELSWAMTNYRLYRTPQWIYTYDDTGNQATHFYRYLTIEPVEYGNPAVVVPESFRVTSKVIWSKRGYHEFELSTVVADRRRI